MMNLSETISAIKMDLGIYGVSLPFPDENKVFAETIQKRTIRTFSQFYPHMVRMDLDLNDLKCIKSLYNESIYEIPDVFGERRLLFVNSVTPQNTIMGNGYVDPVFNDSVEIYDSIMMVQASANLLSAVVPAFTFKYVEPNLLHLFNISSLTNQVNVEFALEHFANLSSIPNTTWETFYELALLDMKRRLYGVLKHYNELQTAYGTINLRIDDWANAEADRKEMIEHWRDVYHMDSTDQFFII